MLYLPQCRLTGSAHGSPGAMPGLQIWGGLFQGRRIQGRRIQGRRCSYRSSSATQSQLKMNQTNNQHNDRKQKLPV